MKKVFFIPGGFQSARQEFETYGKVTIQEGEKKHATQCINEGLSGQLFFTGLAWSVEKDSLIRETLEWVSGCTEDDIEIIDAKEEVEY